MKDLKKVIKSTIQEFVNEQVLSSDNIINFTRLTKFRDRKNYADENFKFLNKGTGRYVYDINNEYVLKLANNNKGIEQNKTEINISESGKYYDIIANVIEYDKNGLYLIQKKANEITEEEFTNITGLKVQSFLSYNKNWESKNPKFYNKVNSLIEEFDLDRFDISTKNSWGTINDDVVIVDYGLNNNTSIKLYGNKY
jgi:hypothetical protein